MTTKLNWRDFMMFNNYFITGGLCLKGPLYFCYVNKVVHGLYRFLSPFEKGDVDIIKENNNQMRGPKFHSSFY